MPTTKRQFFRKYIQFSEYKLCIGDAKILVEIEYVFSRNVSFCLFDTQVIDLLNKLSKTAPLTDDKKMV